LDIFLCICYPEEVWRFSSGSILNS
jgi:hypothetical protein